MCIISSATCKRGFSSTGVIGLGSAPAVNKNRPQQISDIAPVLSNYHYELSATNKWKTECVA